jgi:hypothetical protein
VDHPHAPDAAAGGDPPILRIEIFGPHGAPAQAHYEDHGGGDSVAAPEAASIYELVAAEPEEQEPHHMPKPEFSPEPPPAAKAEDDSPATHPETEVATPYEPEPTRMAEVDAEHDLEVDPDPLTVPEFEVGPEIDLMPVFGPGHEPDEPDLKPAAEFTFEPAAEAAKTWAEPAPQAEPSQPRTLAASPAAFVLAESAGDLAAREAALQNAEILLEAEHEQIARREERLERREHELTQRARDVAEREIRVEGREAELEAAFGLREDRVEQREAELAELEEKLARKERELQTYVGQIQAQLARS